MIILYLIVIIVIYAWEPCFIFRMKNNPKLNRVRQRRRVCVLKTDQRPVYSRNGRRWWLWIVMEREGCEYEEKLTFLIWHLIYNSIIVGSGHDPHRYAAHRAESRRYCHTMKCEVGLIKENACCDVGVIYWCSGTESRVNDKPKNSVSTGSFIENWINENVWFIAFFSE